MSEEFQKKSSKNSTNVLHEARRKACFVVLGEFFKTKNLCVLSRKIRKGVKIKTVDHHQGWCLGSVFRCEHQTRFQTVTFGLHRDAPSCRAYYPEGPANE